MHGYKVSGLQDFNVKNEFRIGRDKATFLVAVAEFWGNEEVCLVAMFQVHDALVKTRDHLSATCREHQWLADGKGVVEGRAIFQDTEIVYL